MATVPAYPQRRLGPLAVDPERGTLLAAATVALAVAVALTNVRFEDEWAAGGMLLFTGIPAALLVAMAFLAPSGEGPPPAWVSAVLVAAFALTVLALGSLADVLGADDGLDSSGTITWVGLLLLGLLGSFVARHDSGVCTLLAGLVATVTVLAFVDWAFGLDDPLRTFRWLLMLSALGLAAAAAAIHEGMRRHAVALIDAAGVVVLALALTFAVEALLGAITSAFGVGDSGGGGAGWGWELFVLAAGGGLVAYASVARAPGPGYLGAFNLVAFALLAGDVGGDEPSLVGWPLLLLLVAVAGLAAALWPRPPQAAPAAAAAGPPPTAPPPGGPGAPTEELPPRP